MAIILKNTAMSEKQWGGISVASLSQYTIQEADKYRLLSDLVFLSDLTNKVALINDGNIDTDYETSILLLRSKELIYINVITIGNDLSFSGTLEII